MAFTDKEENIDAMAQQRRADYIASVEREMREWREEFKKVYGFIPCERPVEYLDKPIKE